MRLSSKDDAVRVAECYDHGAGKLFKTIWGDNLHVGLWSGADDNSSLSQAQERLTDLMVDKLKIKPGGQLLDVGCGTGWPAIRAARLTGCRVVGISISHSDVQFATERARTEGMASRVCFQEANAMNLPFADQSFDAALALESMTHMDRISAAEELKRVLRPGARLVMSDFVEIDPLTQEERDVVYSVFELHSILSRNRLVQLFSNLGLVVEEEIDISRNIVNTVPKTVEILGQNYDSLIRNYGHRTTEITSQFCESLEILKNRGLGYLILIVCNVGIPPCSDELDSLWETVLL